MTWKQNNDVGPLALFQQPEFNLLIEQSRLNSLSFSERLQLANEHDLLPLAAGDADNHSYTDFLTQSPFNDDYLWNAWGGHHKLDQQQLASLHDNGWLQQITEVQVAIKSASLAAAKNDKQIQAENILLPGDYQLGKLTVFKGQINSSIANITEALPSAATGGEVAFQASELISAFLPKLLGSLSFISNKSIDYIEQKYQLEADDSQAFCYRLFNHFPAMLRQVNQALSYWQAYLLEFARHLVDDFEQLAKVFFPKQPLGRFQSISSEQGDTHNQGRSVLVCRFSCGKSLVYKPRSLALEQAFYQFLDFVTCTDEMPDFYHPRFLLGEHHGWMEYIQPLSCENREEIAQYYHNAGCLLSVLYLLEAEDIHFENVVAHGSSPVIIDLETLFHLREDSVLAEQAQAVKHSVLKSHFIMQYQNAVPEQDLAAIFAVSDAGVGVQRPALPTLAGRSVPVNEYGEDFIRGFSCGYQQLLNLKAQLPAQLLRFKGLPARYVARATRIYHSLWQSSCQPYYQQSMMKLELCYEKLWLDIKKFPDLAQIIPAEKKALLQGDIPLLVNVIGEKSLFLEGEEICQDYFSQDSLSLVLAKLELLSRQDCRAQLKIIKLSLQLNQQEKMSVIKNGLPLAGQGRGHNWLEISQSIGQKVIEQAAVAEHSVFWPVFKYDHQGQACLDASNFTLHDGVSGILLYLAYLNEIKPETIAPELLKQSAAEFLHGLAAENFIREGCGAFTGVGGVLYLISHLQSLWQEDWLQEFARVFMAKLAGMAALDRVFDVMAGSAGAILCLLSYESVAKDKQALTLACTFGDHLVASFCQSKESCGWRNGDLEDKILTGFSHGIAGIAYALISLSTVSGKSKYRQVALAAIKYEQSTYHEKIGNWLDLRLDSTKEQKQQAMSAWCNGAMGIGYSRLLLLEHLDQKSAANFMSDIEKAKLNILAHPELKNHGLCHGHFGNQEFICQLLQAGLCDEVNQQAFIRGINRYLLALNNEGLSHHKAQFESLGLMEGLSGIGYQLLRFSSPRQLPSVLMLQPPLK